MKKNQNWKLLSLVLALASAGVAEALELGDPAPALQIQEWIRGEPVKLGEGTEKAVYVVDFWASYSPICRRSIPQLSQLQMQFKDRNVIVVGVSPEPVDTVKPFIEELGSRVIYAVGVDKGNLTFDAYMRRFGVDSMPRSFVVNREGRVVWHGHPLGQLKEVLSQVLAGTFDPDAQTSADPLTQMSRDYLNQARAGKTSAELAKIGPTFLRQADKNPMLLNHFAWSILTDPRIKTREVDLALAAAKSAHEASEVKAPAIIDTYARALFESGDKEQAIKLQKDAVRLADDARLKERLQQTLSDYEKKAEKP